MTDNDKFTWQGGDLQVSQCAFCKHKRRGNYCLAFPDGQGIPADIMQNKVDHTRPYKGDNGIRFEKRS